MRNQRGAALITFFMLLPLFLSMAMGLTALASVLFVQKLTAITCREEMLAAQKRLTEPLNQLLALNPEARRLHRIRKLTKPAKVLAGGAQAIFIYDMFLRAFVLRQKMLLTQVHLASVAPYWLLPNKLRSALNSHHAFPESLETHAVYPLKRAGLRQEKLDDILSTYEPEPEFAKDQFRQMRWDLNLEKLVSEQMQWFQLRHLQVHGSCASTVERKENQWHPRLAKARY